MKNVISMIKNIVVVGASRGLGFEFVNQYLQKNAAVTAGYWYGPKNIELSVLANNQARGALTLKPLDMSNDNSILEFADSLPENVDLLILNPSDTVGFWDRKPPISKPNDSASSLWFQALLDVNVNAPRKLLTAIAPKLKFPDACVAYLTTQRSVRPVMTGFDSYAVSESAGNALIYDFCKEQMLCWHKKHSCDEARLARSPGAFAISPGALDGTKGTLSPVKTVREMISVIDVVRSNKQYQAVYDDKGNKISEYLTPGYIQKIIDAGSKNNLDSSSKVLAL